MSSSIGKKLHDAFFYFGATGFGFFASVFSFPFFSEYLSYEEFASYNYFINYSGFFGFAFALNLYMYYMANINVVHDKTQLLRNLIGTLVFWNLVIVAVVFFSSHFVFVTILKTRLDARGCLLPALLVTSLTSIKGIYLIHLRLSAKSFRFFLFSVISKIGTIGLGLVMVITISNTASQRLIAAMLIEFSIVLFILRDLKWRWHTISLEQIKPIWRFIWPLLISSIAYYPLVGVDQIILERSVDASQLALYSIGLNFANYLHTFNFSIYQTMEPELVRHTSSGSIRSLLKTIFVIICPTIFSTIVFIFFSKSIAGYLTSGKYTNSYYIADILVIAYLFVMLFSIGNTMLTVLHKPRLVLFANCVGLFVVVVACLIGANSGVVGTAIGRTFAFGILSVIVLSYALKERKKLILAANS